MIIINKKKEWKNDVLVQILLLFLKSPKKEKGVDRERLGGGRVKLFGHNKQTNKTLL